LPPKFLPSGLVPSRTKAAYEFEGRTFRSLSAVAREITGTRWNGKVFFGLKKVYGRKAEGGSDA
jgi:hypothetical protein